MFNITVPREKATRFDFFSFGLFSMDSFSFEALSIGAFVAATSPHCSVNRGKTITDLLNGSQILKNSNLRLFPQCCYRIESTPLHLVHFRSILLQSIHFGSQSQHHHVVL